MGRGDIIKIYSSFILLSSLFPLLHVDAFLLTVVFACIRPCDTKKVNQKSHKNVPPYYN